VANATAAGRTTFTLLKLMTIAKLRITLACRGCDTPRSTIELRRGTCPSNHRCFPPPANCRWMLSPLPGSQTNPSPPVDVPSKNQPHETENAHQTSGILHIAIKTFNSLVHLGGSFTISLLSANTKLSHHCGFSFIINSSRSVEPKSGSRAAPCTPAHTSTSSTLRTARSVRTAFARTRF